VARRLRLREGGGCATLAEPAGTLANKTRGGCFLGIGDLVGVGHAGFEVVGGCDWGRREGTLAGAKNQKQSCRSSVLVNDPQGGCFLGRGNPVGVGYAGFEAVRGCDWVRREGALAGAKNQKPSCRSSVLVNEPQGDCFSGRGRPVGVGYTGFKAVGGCDWGV
jgi:hypothetical protein